MKATHLAWVEGVRDLRPSGPLLNSSINNLLWSSLKEVQSFRRDGIKFKDVTSLIEIKVTKDFLLYSGYINNQLIFYSNDFNLYFYETQMLNVYCLTIRH